MKTPLRLLAILSLLASSFLFAQPASAIGVLYSFGTNNNNGDVACSTSGFFTITNNVVTSHTGCAGTATIPQGVTAIGGNVDGKNTYAFDESSALTSVIIPNSVTTIGEFSFSGAGITSVDIPISVREIKRSAFSRASSLTSLTIGNGVTSIGADAFNSTNLSSLTIPNSVTSIGENVFGFFGGALNADTYQYCGSALTGGDLGAAGLSSKINSCARSIGGSNTATITAGDVTNSKVATFSNGVTEAVIPANDVLPSVKLKFAGTAPTAVTVVPMSSNSALLTATPFKVAGVNIVDIKITGTFSGVATVCLEGASTDSVFHYTGTPAAWVELANRKYDNGQVCGDTTSFSPFTAAPANTNPSASGSVIATATGKRSATVSFTAPTSDGGSVITSYTVISTPGSITKTLTQSASGAFNVTGLQPGTSYTFSVTATNSLGTSVGVTSNSIKTTAADVASLTAITFTDDGTGTAGKLAWSGKNIDAVLYTGPAASYPGPFNFGAFSTSWNGTIRNLTPETDYMISIFALSVDGIGESKGLTFKTGAKSDVVKNLNYWNTWLTANTFVPGEAASISNLLSKFDSLATSPHRAHIKVPTSRVSKVEVTSLTPASCSVVSATAKVDAGLVKALTTDKCTISYAVTGASKAPATLVKDFVFKKVAN